MIALNPFKPGIALMRVLRLPTKLGVLALVLLIPLLVVSYFLIERLNESIRVSRDEVVGAAIVSALSDVVAATQVHSGKIYVLLSSGTTDTQSMAPASEALDQAIAVVQQRVAQRPDFSLALEWAPLKDKLLGLKSVQWQSPIQAFAQHRALIDELQRFTYVTSERSSLLFDPTPASYLLINMLVSELPAWSEALGEVRGIGAGELAKAERDPSLVTETLLMIRASLDKTVDMDNNQKLLASTAKAI